jgi:subtilisin family serine protease
MSEVFLPPAWVRNTLGWPTGAGVRVGIINSGFDLTLHDARVLPGTSFVDPDDDFATRQTNDVHDRLGSGTACAHLVLSVAPEAEVVPIRILGGDNETSPATLQQAIRWAGDQRLDVVTIGAGTTIEGLIKPLYVACEHARRQGCILVAAGHMEGRASYPAIFDSVIGVSSSDLRSPWDYRYHLDAGEECEAWGESVSVVSLGGRWTTRTGTMYAAANIAGIAALFRERSPGAGLDRIRALLQRFAR